MEEALYHTDDRKVAEGEFASVSAGKNHTCGVRADGSVACWGRDGDGEATAPEGEFASVSAEGAHVCGLRVDGSVACWGDDEHGEATPPEEQFASVSAGGCARLELARAFGRTYDMSR